MNDGYDALPSSHLLGSVPAVIADDKRPAAVESPSANAQRLSPAPTGSGGYQPPGGPPEGDNQAASTWRGIFSISSYSPYFNVDTDVVVDRILSSVKSFGGNFSAKIDTNPDLYGPIWISTTLIFTLFALGNCASYLMLKKSAEETSWDFDVNYVNWAACVVYGYVVIIPAGFYFLLQYFGTSASLIRLWCMWGYSLFIFIPCSLLLVIPVELVRWIITILVGASSAAFIASNVKTLVPGEDMMVVVVSAFLLQLALAFLMKIMFFA